MNPSDKASWTQSRIHMPHHKTFDVADFAPKAWAAICELCGGEDRIAPWSRQWSDALIINLGSPETEGRDVPPRELDGWHVDGDFFVHYLDSPEQGLLVIPLYSDIIPAGGGTVLCPDGMAKVARHLHDHPEGVSPQMVPRVHPDFSTGKSHNWFHETAKSCSMFVEATGQCGDVFLLHPLMLHTASLNPLRQLRIITNPPVALREAFRFERPDGNYSLVEQTTLRALGRKSLSGWTIAAPRENVVPERLKAQARMKEEETKRMEAAKTNGATA